MDKSIVELQIQNAFRLIGADDESSKIWRTFSIVLSVVYENNWMGACHAVSSVFYVLCKEQDIDADLYIGEAKYKNNYFDHSWIVINQEIYDISITHSLPEYASLNLGAVFKTIDLLSTETTVIEYGASSGSGYDKTALAIKSLPFIEYMSNYPEFDNGLWDLVITLGNVLNLNLDFEQLVSKYTNTQWNEV